MGAQMRLPGDSRNYNVNRDVAHCARYVIEVMLARFEADSWPELTTFCQVAGASKADIAKAMSAYIKTIAELGDHRQKMEESLIASGWFDCPWAARVAVMAMLGVTMFGIQWQGIREATLNGVGPTLTMRHLIRSANEAVNKVLR